MEMVDTFNHIYGPAEEPAENKVLQIQWPAVRQKAVDIAAAWAGLRSTDGTDADRGGEIDKIEALWGLHGDPWCAMFACYCTAKALMFTENLTTLEDGMQLLASSLCESASCEDLMQQAKQRGAFHAIEDAEEGDMVLYCWNGSGRAEHVGLFLRHIDAATIEDIEGNTTRDGSPSDSHGVYVRTRGTECVLGAVGLR